MVQHLLGEELGPQLRRFKTFKQTIPMYSTFYEALKAQVKCSTQLPSSDVFSLLLISAGWLLGWCLRGRHILERGSYSTPGISGENLRALVTGSEFAELHIAGTSYKLDSSDHGASPSACLDVCSGGRVQRSSSPVSNIPGPAGKHNCSTISTSEHPS